jgi:hypothetical protein
MTVVVDRVVSTLYNNIKLKELAEVVNYSDGFVALVESIRKKATTRLVFDEEDYGIYDVPTLSFTKKPLSSIAGFTRASDATAQHPVSFVTYGSNIPRIEYDTVTGERLGLRMEEQRANLLLHSQYTGASGETPPTGWIIGFNTGVTTTTASTRFAGAIRATQSGIAQREYYTQSVALSASTTYTFSAYFADGTSATNNVLRVVPSASLTGVTSLAATSVTGAGRYSITFTTTTAGTFSLDVGLGVSANATGTVIHETPMLEVSTFAGSYIPTTTSAVTRLADRYNMARPQVSTRKGTIFVWFREAELSVSNAAKTVIKFNDSANPLARGFALTRTNNSLAVHARDSTGFVTTSTVVSDWSKFIKATVSFDYDLGTTRLCVNGGSVVSVKLGSINISGFLSNFIIAGKPAIIGGTILDGLFTFREAWEAPVSLTDEEMQAITRL